MNYGILMSVWIIKYNFRPNQEQLRLYRIDLNNWTMLCIAQLVVGELAAALESQPKVQLLPEDL